MQFNSLGYLAFLAAVFLLFHSVPGASVKRWLLILASLAFLSSAGIVSVATILGVTAIDYFSAIAMDGQSGEKRRNAAFIVGMVLTLANLILFKYGLLEGIRTMIGAFRHGIGEGSLAEVALPLGISFYSFQLIGYLVDVRLGRIRAEKDPVLFAQYILFFPKLLAGPIERAQAFLPQRGAEKRFDPLNISIGGKLIILGLFKKMVIGDRIAIYTNMIYSNLDVHGGVTLAITAFMYVFQVYADFSGYTDIARGSARLFGFELMENFKRPLLAASVTDFWRRWHISLSSWVNDYVYMPLSLILRRLGAKGMMAALFIAFMVVGIWHGANWTFVVFGLLQGFLISLEFTIGSSRKKWGRGGVGFLTRFMGIAFTFIFIAFSLIFFRAASFSQALLFLNRLFRGGRLFVGSPAFFIFSWLGIGFLVLQDAWTEYRGRDMLKISSPIFLLRISPYALLVTAILAVGVLDGGQFIYFQF